MASWGRRLWRRVLRVQRPVALAVGASAAVTLGALADAARPSQSRLHHRDLFVGGRRYYMRGAADGFEIRSDSKTFWSSKRRTPRAAVIEGTLTEAGSITTVRLDARLRPLYLLMALLMPTWMTVLVVAVPWSPLLTGSVVAALYGLALFGCRFGAALQAHEMTYFVRKALEDLPPAVVGELPASTDSVIDPAQRDFDAEWQRFYEARRSEETQSP
jgi:hypothetical protein